MTESPSPVPAVILAGGQARRFGSDKALAMVQGRPLLRHVIDALSPQTAMLCLNGAPRLGFDLPTISDAEEGAGPLAGILAALRWAKDQGYARVLTVPIDVPFLPQDLAHKLAQVEHGFVVVARSGPRTHPVIALWPVELAEPLSRALTQDPNLAVHAFQARQNVRHVAWPVTPKDPFFNINTVDDQHVAEGIS